MAVIKFSQDYQGRLTDNANFDKAGDVVERYNLSTCLLLVEAGIAEWVEQPAEDAPTEEQPVKRTRKAKAATE